MKKTFITILLILSCLSLSAKSFQGFFDIPLDSNKKLVFKNMSDLNYSLDYMNDTNMGDYISGQLSFVNKTSDSFYGFTPSFIDFSFYNTELDRYTLHGSVTSINDFIEKLKIDYPSLSENEKGKTLILSDIYSNTQLEILKYSPETRFIEKWEIILVVTKKN